ncbi:MAG TPA: AbrB/MazE/SpoVT family DNA-binding domain-containing protein [Acidobacteriaceae bacterium]|nr:AbrB/MazE/SpoVT family DNA-binding domain-containing protein [Acidobacteriaceae bacterium]
METRISTKGQIVIPSPLRRKLGIRAGDPLEANIKSGSIVLTPRKRKPLKAKIITDPVTGLPALTAGKSAPVLTSEAIYEILSNFP